jgi:hypothetical protein
MSSSNRYQSRIFNFISQQSRKVADQLDRGLRQLKFAAEGALQATLYPFYLLFQTVRNFGNRLQPAGKENAPQIEGFTNGENPDFPEADTPIQRVLSFLQELPLANFTPQSETKQLAGGSEVNYPDYIPVTQPKAAEKTAAELSAFKELVTTSTDTLNQLNQTSDSPSPLLALGPAPVIPQTPISDRDQILALTNAVENTIAQLDQTANSDLPNLAAVPAIPQTNKTPDLGLPNLDSPLDSPHLVAASEIPQRLIAVPQILGLASTLATRNLILVAAENQTLDILTIEQQQEIQQKIFSEVSSYYQQRQLAENPSALKNDLQLVANQDNLIAPVRQLLRVMAWVQTSPIAVKVNLFDEANILRQQTKWEPENINYQLPSINEFNQSATTNSPFPIPKSPVPQSKFFTIPTPGFLQIQPKVITVKPNNGEEKLTGVEEIEARIENVVESVLSAIDRFLGKDTQQKEQEIVEELYAQYKVPQPSHPEPQPKKRGDRTNRRGRSTPQPSPNQHPSTREIPLYPQAEYNPPPQTEPIFPVPTATKNNPYTPTPEYQPPPRKAQPANAQMVAKVNPSEREKQQDRIVTIGDTEESGKNSAVNPAPEWWEAKVVSTGYIKHPLEQALDSLDKAMLWLEEIGVEIWNWAKTQMEKILSSKK